MAVKQTHLSKNVLQMKFMQRSVLRLEQEQNEEEKQKVIDDEHWVLDLPEYKTKDSQILKDQSYSTCEELLLGRQSYQGFNQEIEKLMNSDEAERALKKSEEKEKETGVSEKEMANRFSSLMGVISKKFAKKRNRNNIATADDEATEPLAKRKFIKPEPE